jgi:hypothetical protein
MFQETQSPDGYDRPTPAQQEQQYGLTGLVPPAHLPTYFDEKQPGPPDWQGVLGSDQPLTGPRGK